MADSFSSWFGLFGPVPRQGRAAPLEFAAEDRLGGHRRQLAFPAAVRSRRKWLGARNLFDNIFVMAGDLSLTSTQGNDPPFPQGNNQTRRIRMKKKLGIAVALIGVTAATFAFAQEDIIKMRQRLMDSNGQAAKVA